MTGEKEISSDSVSDQGSEAEVFNLSDDSKNENIEVPGRTLRPMTVNSYTALFIISYHYSMNGTLNNDKEYPIRISIFCIKYVAIKFRIYICRKKMDCGHKGKPQFSFLFNCIAII